MTHGGHGSSRPSEVRDSVEIDGRLEAVADSLIDAGEDREEVEGAVASLRDPGEAGGFRFGGGDDSLEHRIRDLVRDEEGGRRRFRGGGSIYPGRSESAPQADPGAYIVTLRVGDEEYPQRFTLERTETAPEGG